jgi:GDPmannose 4,6-dehydratase
VTKKIISAACRIANGNRERLHLGNLEIERDWGWAPEYVEAMWRMMQLNSASDFVIATGYSCKLQDFVSMAFEEVGLDWKDHVVKDDRLIRPTELIKGKANPQKAERELGWKAQRRARDVVSLLINSQLDRNKSM